MAKIIIIDDEPAMVEVIVTLCREKGHEVFPFNAAPKAVEQLPTIALDYPNVALPFKATIQFTTAIYGVHAQGTAYRMDEIPIPLRQLMSTSYPTDDVVLDAISAGLSC